MQVKNIIALFHQIEKEFDVEHWTIDELHVWPLIRLDLMMSLSFSESQKQQIRLNFLFKVRQALGMLWGYCKYILRSFLDRQKNAIPQPVQAVFLGDGISRVLLNEKWFDRFCDPLIEALTNQGQNSFMMEPLHHYIVPRFTPSLFIQPHLDFGLIKNMLFKKRHFKSIHLKNFDRFMAFLQSQHLNIPLPDEERVKTILLVVKAYAEVYKKILQKTRPLLGFVVCYYGPRGLAFNLACRQLGITSIDIQHGVAGEANPAYGQWSKVPPHGYEMLPSLFWCWTQEDALAIERWNSPVKSWHKAIVGGHPFVHFWKQNTSRQAMDIAPEKGSTNLLVTLSYVEDHNATLLSLLIEAIQRSDNQWKWWIRLHPCLKEKKEEIKKMFSDHHITHVEIDRATDLPLYFLLSQADVHVTHASATVVEARIFGVPSVVTSEDAVQYFADEISTEWAIYAATTSKILEAIESQLTKKRMPYEGKNGTAKMDGIIQKILQNI